MNLLENKLTAVEELIVQGSEVSTKQLQMEIQGSLLVRMYLCCSSIISEFFSEVNVGPLAIGDTFVTKEYPNSARSQILLLLQSLAKVLRKAVELNRKLINDSQVKFQAALEKGCDKFDERVGLLSRM